MYEMDEEDYLITFHRQNYEVINQEYTVIGRLINNQINH